MQTLRNVSTKKKPIPFAYLGVGAATLFMVLAFTLYPGQQTSLDRSELHLGTVQRGPIVRQVKAPGRFVPNSQTWVTARVDARVKARLLEPGAAVSEQTVILELSAPELTQSYRQAQIEVKVAEARLQAARALQKNEFRQQEASVELTQVEKDLAIQESEAQKILANKKIITDFEYQAAVLQVKQLATQLRNNKQSLSELPGLQQSLLRVEEAEVELLQLRVDLLRDQVDSLLVRSDTPGILQSLPLEVGQRVTRGDELARVTNQDDLKVELSVQEAQAKDLALGQIVVIDTRRSKVTGRVSRIDPAVSNGAVVVDVQFDDGLPSEARPELRVDGVIEIERLDDVLFVAKPMLWRPGRTAAVFRVDSDSTARKTEVSYGIASVANVQLLAGLSEGDMIVLSDLSTLELLDEIDLN